MGERLRWFREAADLTQEALAHRAGCAVKTVNQTELGHTSPRIDLLEQLVVDGLQMPLAYFFSSAAPEGLRTDLRLIESLIARQPAAVRAKLLRGLKAMLKAMLDE